MASTPNFFPIPAGLTRDLFPEPAKPKQPRDPRKQAFLDDLVAVYVKHQLCVYSHEFVEIQELGQETEQASHLVVTDEGELLFLDEAPEDAAASSHIPNPTAHTRLAAAARVASIHNEQEH